MRNLILGAVTLALLALAPAAGQAAERPPCTNQAIKSVVQGKVISKKCSRKWAAGTVRPPGGNHQARFLVKATQGKRGSMAWSLLTRSQLSKACGPKSTVPDRILRLSPCRAG